MSWQFNIYCFISILNLHSSLISPAIAIVPLPPSALGNLIARTGELSYSLKETATWKAFNNFTSESDSLNSLMRIFVDSFMSNLRQTSTVIVSAPVGHLRGSIKKLDNGQIFFFKGIRYGQAPIGNRRFKSALPEKSWSDIRDATNEGSSCPHRTMILEQYRGTEDCLFLNVYTPELPLINGKNPKLPVMVWVHGGGFSFGSGSAFLYGPDYLVPEGVVLVTFNYRMGPLGFLSVNSDVPGNAGLKDQVLALKWVRNNIAAFGGDANSVTIFGQSAGSASVHLLMMSDMAKGLFHKAIAQSGSAINPWVIGDEPQKRAFRLGSVLGMPPTNNTKELLRYLRTVSPRKLIDASPETITLNDGKRGIGFSFVPVVEKAWKNSKEHIFLADDPVNLLRDGKFRKIPFIMGFNTHEAMLLMRRKRKDPNLLNTINSDFQRIIPSNLNVGNRYSSEGWALTRKIRSFYLGPKNVSEDTIYNMINLMTDTLFVHGIVDTIRLHAYHSPRPQTYLYHFDYDGALGIFKRMLAINKPGVCHGDEIGYLFKFGMLNLNKNSGSSEVQVIQKMTKMWTNFAKYGNPTPFGTEDPILQTNWIPNDRRTSEDLPHLIIDSGLHMSTHPETNRLKFWDEIYEKYNGEILRK